MLSPSLSWQLNQSSKSRCTAGVVLLGTQAGTKAVWLAWKSTKCAVLGTQLHGSENGGTAPPINCHSHTWFLPLTPWDWEGGSSNSFYTITDWPHPIALATGYNNIVPEAKLTSCLSRSFFFLPQLICIMYLATPSTSDALLSHYLNEFIEIDLSWFLYSQHRMVYVNGKCFFKCTLGITSVRYQFFKYPTNIYVTSTLSITQNVWSSLWRFNRLLRRFVSLKS